MWTILQAEDAINGAEGTCSAVIEGRAIDIMELMNITATIDKTKSDFKALGSRATQHKTTGWNGTGSATVRYVSSRWARMIIDYIKTGKDVYFDIIIKNEDPSSATGKQVIKVSKCNLDGTDIAKLDIDADFLDQPINFTFSDVDLITEFNALN